MKMSIDTNYGTTLVFEADENMQVNVEFLDCEGKNFSIDLTDNEARVIAKFLELNTP